MLNKTGKSKRYLKAWTHRAVIGLVLLMCFTFLVSEVRAQGDAGTITPPSLTPGLPAGTYPLSGFDSVNLFNGNLNFHLPLVNIGGRGGAKSTLTLKIEERWRVQP